jgi:outer membrane protein assembly factor BamA
MNGVERRVLYLAARAVLLAVVGGGVLGGQSAVCGQSGQVSDVEAPAEKWQLVVEGERAEWPGTAPTAPVDSIRRVGQSVIAQWQRAGHYYARLDSAVVDTTGPRPAVRLYAYRGPQVNVGRLRIEGAAAVGVEEIRRLMDTEEGDLLNARRLEADVQALLDRYEKAGHPLAQIRISETKIDKRPPPRLRVTLRIDEGPSLWLKRIEVPDDARVSSGLVARLAGLQRGGALTDYDPEAIRAALQESPLFESVAPPELRVTAEGGAILRVPVEEAPPGSFDLVVGYLPPSGVRDAGQLVGSGHLLLENLFGGGRRMDLTLDRRPGQTSLFDLSVSDPYIFGLPFRLTAQFEGEQRDSTYGERSYGLDAGYQFGGGVELTGSLSREVVTPGQAGAQLQSGRQRIPRSQTLFYGLGVRYDAVDRRANPRRGFRLRVRLEQGQKDRTRRRITAAGDTTRARQSLRQERLRGRVRGFVPLFDRQVLVLGGDASVLRSRAYDRSDLFRFGGAESLRGYDEDRFLGNVAARGLLEYRLQLDRRSYAYAFGDLGYVARPALGEASSTRDWHPGYGIGLQLQTAIGRIKTTYALNPEVATPVDGRIHFGLSVGL